MSKYPKICFERILPRELYRPQRMMAFGGRLRAVFEFRKMWMNGSNLLVRFMDGTAAQRAKVKGEALWWTEHANLTFEFNDAPDAQIRITFDPTSGAWSFVGTDCQIVFVCNSICGLQIPYFRVFNLNLLDEIGNLRGHGENLSAP